MHQVYSRRATWPLLQPPPARFFLALNLLALQALAHGPFAGLGGFAGLGPATSSAPFVATRVDVTELITYFSVALLLLLRGTLL